MPVLTEMESRPEEVGQILIKVQEDLRQLREKLSHGDGKSVNIEELENALSKTEQGLQQRTEQVLNHINNQVQTLPNAMMVGRDRSRVLLESTWDLKTQTKSDVRKMGGQQYLTREKLRQPQPPGSMLPGRQSVQLQGLTPGQQSKQMLALRAVVNPYSQQNRQVLNDNYSIQLPLIHQKKDVRLLAKPVIGGTVDPLAVLPKANRVDAQLAPPPITEDDARKGILSLIERGLIPPAAQLTLDPSPVRHKQVPLHAPEVRGRPPAISELSHNLAGVRLDLGRKQSNESLTRVPVIPPHPRSAGTDTRSQSAKSRGTSATRTMAKTPATVKTYEMPLQPFPPPTTPASGEVKSLTHRFAIQNGRARDNTSDFMTFKQHYCLTWGSIVTMMKYLEKLMTNYAVPVAFVHGDKLADLSLEFELERPPSRDDLLSVLINKDDVEDIIYKPGRRFLGADGKEAAAAEIQAGWKMYLERTKYLEYRRKKWAAGVIAISWIMHLKMIKVRQQLKQTRLDQIESFKFKAKKFAASWDRIKNSRRLIIHLPSLGLSQKIRETFHDFNIRQNTQMARLCDIRDPNVDVLFISPVPLSDETVMYYSKLLGLKSAIDSGNVDDQGNMSERYKIIVPDAIKSFPTHRMCLSTTLKYSPVTVKRIKNLIKGREAYIVPSVPHKDDLTLAEILDVPLLSPLPEIAHLYSTKSGCKRIFASAKVDAPPTEYDVYSLGQLHECLAQLVTDNLEVKRWLFKLDEEFDGRGIAFCDVTSHMNCYDWVLKESQRYDEKWNKKWAQEKAFLKIHGEMPEILAKYAEPLHKPIYPDWETFLDAFLSQGGVIEACPASESITTMTVNMLIEPNGKSNIICCGDQIHADSQFSYWGISIPQSSVEPEVLNRACLKIAAACKARGVVGYFAIDFVTFIDGKTMEQKLWALDLSLHYSDSLAMYQLMTYVSNGKLDTKTHMFDVPPPVQDKKPRKRRLLGQEDEPPPNSNRYAVMSTQLLHTNLSVVHYSVFFQMCRAHGIGYDIKEKQGTIFTLIDSFSRERLGMLTIGDNLQGVLATFARNMSVIHQEISAPNMQGETNFKAAIEDIEGILGTTLQNAEEETETEQY